MARCASRRTTTELSRLSARVETLRQEGFAHEELIGGAELKTLVPAISDHCVGAIVARADGAANPVSHDTRLQAGGGTGRGTVR